jgi:hypothetical protein
MTFAAMVVLEGNAPVKPAGARAHGLMGHVYSSSSSLREPCITARRTFQHFADRFEVEFWNGVPGIRKRANLFRSAR